MVVRPTRLTLTEKSVAVANDAMESAANNETIGLMVDAIGSRVYENGDLSAGCGR